MPSLFCACCKRQGHIISDCQGLKARKDSKHVVAYTSAESSFKQDFMPFGFSHCHQMGNELYRSPPRKDCTCSSLTSRDYVPLCGDFMPVYQDSISDKNQYYSDPSKDYDFNETSHDFQVFSRENLIAQLKNDSEIYSLFNKALSWDEIFTVPVGYYF